MRVDPGYVAGLTAAIGTSSAAQQRLTAELSSGLRVATLSDDAAAVSDNVFLQSSISGLDSFVQSSSREQSLLQVTDSTLGQVISQVTSALSLAVSAGNGALSSSNLSAIGRQIADLRDGVVALANSTYQGKYLFSGSQAQTQPFTLDSSGAPAIASYHGDALTQKVETPDGQKVQVNVAGTDVFTAPGADLLSALNKLVADVTGGSTSSIQADASVLTAALTNVTQQRSALGSSLSQLTATRGYAQTQETNLQARQTQMLASDPAKVATDLRNSDVQRQALLAVAASANKVNLFDYLK